MLTTLPAEVKRVATVLQAAGKQAYLVGGALRDGLLGLVPHDWDVATDARPEEVAALFGREGRTVLPTGLRFGTVTVLFDRLPVEITTFRADGEYRDFRRPAHVSYTTNIVADLSRRDFTVNALALDLQTWRLIDPFTGRKDLARRLARTVGHARDRFGEDPLRMLRGYRLVAELDFTLESACELAAATYADLVARVSPERIQAELGRILTGGWAAGAVEGLARTGLLFVVIPELGEGWAFPQQHPAHSWTVFRHLVETVRHSPPKLVPRLAALLHDVAKPRCFSLDTAGVGHAYGHERLGAEMTGRILRRLRWDNRTRQAVETLVRWHMFPLTMAAGGIRRLVLRVGEERMDALLALKQADILATGPAQLPQAWAALAGFRRRLTEVRQGRQAISVRELAIDGDDVMRILRLPPGPAVGRILRALHQEVLAEPAKNTREYLEQRLTVMTGRNPSLPGE